MERRMAQARSVITQHEANDLEEEERQLVRE
jgi:hypothetical protein